MPPFLLTLGSPVRLTGLCPWGSNSPFNACIPNRHASLPQHVPTPTPHFCRTKPKLMRQPLGAKIEVSLSDLAGRQELLSPVVLLGDSTE